MLVGLDPTIQQLCDAVSKHNLIFLVGPPKSGKSTCIDKLFETSLISSCRINTNYIDIHSHKEFQNILSKSITNRSILEMINCKEKAVVFEDIDSLHVQDRYAIGYMVSFLNNHNLKECKTRIIISCSRTEERRLQDLQKIKDSCTVYVNEPSLDDLYKYFVATKRYKITKRELEQLCKRFKNSFSQIRSYLDSSMDGAELQDYHDSTIYEFVENILKKGVANVDDILINDPSITTLMLYENIAKNIKNAHSLLEMSRAFINSSIIEEFAYKSTEWDLLEHVVEIRTHAVNIAMKNTKFKGKIQYTQIPSRSAQYYINSKRIAKNCETLKLDYHEYMELCNKVSNGDIKLPHRSEESVCCNLITRNLTGKLFLR